MFETIINFVLIVNSAVEVEAYMPTQSQAYPINYHIHIKGLSFPSSKELSVSFIPQVYYTLVVQTIEPFLFILLFHFQKLSYAFFYLLISKAVIVYTCHLYKFKIFIVLLIELVLSSSIIQFLQLQFTYHYIIGQKVFKLNYPLLLFFFLI